MGALVKSSDLQGDERLFQALVSGSHVQNAAVVAGVSERTAYRRLADPVFRQQVESARDAVRESIISRLSDAAGDAISKLWGLLDNEDPSIQLKASKALLDSLVKVQALAPKTRTTVSYSVEHTRDE